MPLSTFSVTPVNPVATSYNFRTGLYDYDAWLYCFGAFLSPWVSQRLIDQSKEDKAVLRYRPIKTPAPKTLPDDWYTYSNACLGFKTKATTNNQYRMIYHVVGTESARAAFYLNGNLVKSEDVTGEQYIAILVDCPPPQTKWRTYMFLEGTYPTGYPLYLELKGIKCYII